MAVDDVCEVVFVGIASLGGIKSAVHPRQWTYEG